MSAQIIQETSHIEFELYFPAQLNLGNAKNSLDVEDPHHYNIFSENVECKTFDRLECIKTLPDNIFFSECKVFTLTICLNIDERESKHLTMAQNLLSVQS